MVPPLSRARSSLTPSGSVDAISSVAGRRTRLRELRKQRDDVVRGEGLRVQPLALARGFHLFLEELDRGLRVHQRTRPSITSVRCVAHDVVQAAFLHPCGELQPNYTDVR